mmetsp:Transcript_28741/g.55958  ORF Transcript_28741/g.55958 Transcript_28741/m.55958 type:complete len:261 (+) Transcript_28741:238-1020(+)
MRQRAHGSMFGLQAIGMKNIKPHRFHVITLDWTDALGEYTEQVHVERPGTHVNSRTRHCKTTSLCICQDEAAEVALFGDECVVEINRVDHCLSCFLCKSGSLQGVIIGKPPLSPPLPPMDRARFPRSRVVSEDFVETFRVRDLREPRGIRVGCEPVSIRIVTDEVFPGNPGAHVPRAAVLERKSESWFRRLRENGPLRQLLVIAHDMEQVRVRLSPDIFQVECVSRSGLGLGLGVDCISDMRMMPFPGDVDPSQVFVVVR